MNKNKLQNRNFALLYGGIPNTPKLRYLPENFGGLKAEEWLYNHSEQVTMGTILDTYSLRKKFNELQCNTLIQLLSFVRMTNSAAPPFKVDRTGAAIDGSSRPEQSESSLRDDVRKNPKEFIFHPIAMLEYHSVHRAELIKILLEILDAHGINAHVEDNMSPLEAVSVKEFDLNVIKGKTQ